MIVQMLKFSPIDVLDLPLTSLPATHLHTCWRAHMRMLLVELQHKHLMLVACLLATILPTYLAASKFDDLPTPTTRYMCLSVASRARGLFNHRRANSTIQAWRATNSLQGLLANLFADSTLSSRAPSKSDNGRLSGCV